MWENGVLSSGWHCSRTHTWGPLCSVPESFLHVPGPRVKAPSVREVMSVFLRPIPGEAPGVTVPRTESGASVPS